MAEHRVIVYFRSYPGIGQATPVTKVLTMRDTHKAANQILQANLRSVPIGGIFATYAGFLTASGPSDGKIIFLRKHKKELFDIIISPQINPVILHSRTVHHWQLNKPQPGKPATARAYQIERIKDEETGLYYWSTAIVPLPDNGIVPLLSLVIFAKPDEVYIPQGFTFTTDNPQLILPDVYITKKIDVAEASVGVLNIMHFFRLVRPQAKKGSETSWIWQLIDE